MIEMLGQLPVFEYSAQSRVKEPVQSKKLLRSQISPRGKNHPWCEF